MRLRFLPVLVAAALAVSGCARSNQTPVSSPDPNPAQPAVATDPAPAASPMGIAIAPAFWQQQEAEPLADLFPRDPGQQLCDIPHGGPAPSTDRLSGTCSTLLSSPTDADLAVVHAGQRADARYAVTLIEVWSGPSSDGKNSAGWVFVVDQGWHVLGIRVLGLPPQAWK